MLIVNEIRDSKRDQIQACSAGGEIVASNRTTVASAFSRRRATLQGRLRSRAASAV